MRVLLLGMPGHISFAASNSYPNLGICSLAAHVEKGDVRCLDLRLVRDVEKTVKRLVIEMDPDLVGFSAMACHFDAAARIAAIVKGMKPSVRTVLGGYHATTGYAHVAESPHARVFDFLCKGESELAFNDLVEALRCGDGRFDRIAGLSFWDGDHMVHNPPSENLDLRRIRLPARHARLRTDFLGWGRRIDCIETSRGCTLPCSYCSITRMYGRTFREYDLDRVIEDVRVMQSEGVERVFIVDDNITLNVPRLRQLCERILSEEIDLVWDVQATVVGIARNPDLPPLLKRAGFSNVFLGIEHMSRDVLKQYKKGGSPNLTLRAVRSLADAGLRVIGGFIIGAPGETRASISELARNIKMVDVHLPYLQMLTPYPGTPQRGELLERGLVVNESDFSRYDGFHANVRTEHLSASELEWAFRRTWASVYLDPRTRAGRDFWRNLRKPPMWSIVGSFANRMTRRPAWVRPA